MAKLSARGRTEVVRVEKMDERDGDRVRTQMALMSDGVILSKRTVIYDPSKNMSRYDSGWSRHARLKPGVDPNHWRERKLADGWSIARR